MSLSVGIVGLPNVGKSTLFNALLKRQLALSANYPFCTIEPNVGKVPVPDCRLIEIAKVTEEAEKLAKGSIPIKYAQIEFLDIAGLVAGASKGEGLGNKFLAYIREVDLICHVMRAFVDDDVVVTGKLDPMEDLATIRMELILKDIETVEKAKSAKLPTSLKLRGAGKILTIKEKQIIENIYKKVEEILNSGKMLNTVEFSEDEMEIIRPLCLLTIKPEIFVVNVGEEDLINFPTIPLKSDGGMSAFFHKEGLTQNDVCYISAKIEAEMAEFSEEEQRDYLVELGLEKSGIERMAQVAYKKLGLISFLTVGQIEARAWQIRKGTLAPQAAGTIHTDFAKKFIKAKVVNYKDFIELGGWKNCAEKGKVRQEGKDYEVKDGDIIEFMIGK